MSKDVKPATTVVKVHRDVATDLARWILLGPGRPDDRRVILQVYLADIVSELERHAGTPDGAVQLQGLVPAVFDWHYSADIRVRFAVRDTRRWCVAVRKVTILRLQPLPLGREVR